MRRLFNILFLNLLISNLQTISHAQLGKGTPPEFREGSSTLDDPPYQAEKDQTTDFAETTTAHKTSPKNYHLQPEDIAVIAIYLLVFLVFGLWVIVKIVVY